MRRLIWLMMALGVGVFAVACSDDEGARQGAVDDEGGTELSVDTEEGAVSYENESGDAVTINAEEDSGGDEGKE